MRSPNPETELQYRSPYELTVAVILSAQCTDIRVNKITPSFFQHLPTVESLAKATEEEVFNLIKSCSYPNNKTKHLINFANTLIHEFNGHLPESRDELMKLPGIGRKTANVLASVLFEQPHIAVDTHVFRVARRIGLASEKDKTPLSVEKKLMKYIHTDQLRHAHHWLILHGRYICKAGKPKCSQCEISMYCYFYQKQHNEKKKAN